MAGKEAGLADFRKKAPYKSSVENESHDFKAGYYEGYRAQYKNGRVGPAQNMYRNGYRVGLTAGERDGLKLAPFNPIIPNSVNKDSDASYLEGYTRGYLKAVNVPNLAG